MLSIRKSPRLMSVFAVVTAAAFAVSSLGADLNYRAELKAAKLPQAATMPQAISTRASIFFPLFIESRNFTSTAVLANASNSSTYVDVILYGLDGSEIATQRVAFPPHGRQQVGIRALLDAAGSRATTGRIKVVQSSVPKGLLVLGQLSLTYTGSGQPNNIDEKLALPSASTSQVLRAVADASDGSPLVAITSLSQTRQSITIDCLVDGQKVSKSIVLRAEETSVTEACAPRVVVGGDFDTVFQGEDTTSRDSIGIALRSDAPAGSFMAYGLAPHGNPGDSFFSGVRFVDPATIVSLNTIFTGMPVGDAAPLPAGEYVPQVALANFSAKDINVRVKYAHTSGDGPVVEEAANLVVHAGSSSGVTLAHLMGDPGLKNSFVILSDGAPGDLMAKVVSTSGSALREVESEGKDAQEPQNGGSHPWSIEQGTDSTLLLFNHGTVSTLFGVNIETTGGNWQKSFQLAPMETKAISFRDVIGNQIKDDHGKALPRGSINGQVGWFTPGGKGGKGRILQSSRDLTMARNFSCSLSYALSDLYATFVPGTTTVPVGNTATFGTFQTFAGDGDPDSWSNANDPCSGDALFNWSSGYVFHWSSANTSIASISGSNSGTSVSMLANAPGTTTVNVFAEDPYDGPCEIFAEPQITVQPIINSISPAQGLIGNTVTVTLNGLGFGTSPTVSAGSGITVTVNSSTGTQIASSFAISGSATSGNHSVTVTAGGQTSSGINFFVQIPTKLIRQDFPNIPNGYGPLEIITPGNVIDAGGNVLLTNRCGVYRDLVYSLRDQQSPSQNIDGTYTLVESFSNYTNTYGGSVPATLNFNMTPGGFPSDVQYLGKVSPACLGNNDHEEFDQSFSVTIGGTPYSLSTVNHIARGEYSGTATVNVTITTP